MLLEGQCFLTVRSGTSEAQEMMGAEHPSWHEGLDQPTSHFLNPELGSS
jgi:hypothetical protein